MGRFSRLLQAKGKDVTIGDEVFNIKPLTGKYLGLFMQMGEDKQSESAKELILASLKQTDDKITMDDIDSLPLNDCLRIINIITEVNELK